MLVDLVDSCDLPFKAHYAPGFSSNGSILLEDYYGPYYYLYELCDGNFSKAWIRNSPSALRDYTCLKAVHTTGTILLQQGQDTDTIQFSRDLLQERIFRRKGRLLGCTNDGQVVYHHGTFGKKDWRIDVWNEQELVMTLTHPATEGRESLVLGLDGWGKALSFCTVGDKTVVVEALSHSLDIFTKQGIP